MNDALLRRQERAHLPEWEFIPEGWAYESTYLRGWDDESIVQAQIEKLPLFLSYVNGTGPLGVSHESLQPSWNDVLTHNTILSYGYSLARAAHHKDRISILDWGGGIGHYHWLSKALLPGVEIEYHCKDLPLFCEAGRTVNPDGIYHDTDDCLNGTYDMVVVSSTLQYMQHWQQSLRTLAHASSGFLFASRVPLVWNTDSFVVLQRPYRYGYDTEYLGWCLNYAAFLSEAVAAGCVLDREFIIHEPADIPLAPEQVQNRGFLFQVS